MSILNRSESRQGARVIWLAVHSTEGDDHPQVNDAVSLRDASWWAGSSHAICDNEALLTPAEGCVPYDLAAWTLRGGNHYSDNIEQVGWAHWSRADWLAHPGTLDNTARWLADRHKARPWIPLVKLSPADVAAKRPGVIGHVDYTLGTGDGTHTDPGPNYPWDVVIAKARVYAGEGEDDMQLTDSLSVNLPDGQGGLKAVTYPFGTWLAWTNYYASQTAAQTAALQGQIAGLIDALKQITTGTVDLDAVKAAAEAGAQEAVERLQLTVTPSA